MKDVSTSERFKAALAAIAPEAYTAPAIGIALSGGPDSLALLILAAATMPGRVRAATVDHGLRPASADEARLAASACASLGVPHAILTPATPIVRAGHGLQAAARDARYAALAKWIQPQGITLLLTGHHASDQAETVLMRLARGAGIAGLAGIRPRQHFAGVLLLRPLLRFTRGELRVIVTGAGLDAVDDPSNADARFDRTMARNLLRQAEWLRPERLAAIADHARDAEGALEWATAQARKSAVTDLDAEWRLRPDGLPAEIVRRLVVEILGHVSDDARDPDATPPCGPDVTRLIATLRAGGKATLGRALAEGGPIWRFGAAPPRRAPETG